MVRSTSCSLAPTRNPPDLIDRARSETGRQNPATEPLNWENTGSNHFQPAFQNPGATEC
jgi:hypothetical protein